MNRRLPQLCVVGVATALAVFAASAPAHAEDPIPLDRNGVSYPPEGTTTALYSISTSGPYWSVVWMKSMNDKGKTVDYDMDVQDGSGAVLASSAYGSNRTDFVAIDSNLRVNGPYLVRTRLYSGAGGGDYKIGFTDENKVIPPLSAAQPVYDLEEWKRRASIQDVYLGAGDCFSVKLVNGGHALGEMALMASNPGRPVQARVDAVARASFGTGEPGVPTLTYTAPRAGWYGFVMVSESEGVSSLPGQYQRVACTS